MRLTIIQLNNQETMATIKQIQTLFTKLKIEPAKRKERVYAWTSGRTSSIKDLQADELQELYDSLVGELSHEKEQLKDVRRRIISNILDIATKEGIKHPNNYDSFNYFMLHKSVAKKYINLCNLSELERGFNAV